MCVALHGNPSQSYWASPAIYDLKVFPCHFTQLNILCLNPSQAGQYSIQLRSVYLLWRDGRLSWPWWLFIITSTTEVMFLPDFVCLSVCLCVSEITQKVLDGSFWNFECMSGNGKNYKWFNFGGDPEGILDFGSLWNFCYHCFQWGIRETTAKLKMVLPPSEQHCLGGSVRALTAF